MAFTNVEGDLVTLLNTATSRPAATKPDKTGVSRFYVVRRTGGPARLRVADGALVVVEAYAKSREDLAIADLNAARDIVLWIRTLGTAHVKSVSEVGGPGNLPDPLLPNYARYTCTFEIVMRA